MKHSKRLETLKNQNPKLFADLAATAKDRLDFEKKSRKQFTKSEFVLLQILENTVDSQIADMALQEALQHLDLGVVLLGIYAPILELLNSNAHAEWEQYRNLFLAEKLAEYFSGCDPQREVIREILNGLESLIDHSEVEELLKKLLAVPFCEFSLEDLGERVHILPNIKEITKLYQGELRMRFSFLEQRCDRLLLGYGGLLTQKID